MTLSFVEEPAGFPDDTPPEVVAALSGETPVSATVTEPTFEPGSKVECPNGCGKTVTVKKDGRVRSHVCDSSGATTVKASRGTTSRRKSSGPPASVRKYGVLALAAGAETVAEMSVAKATGQDRRDIPSEVTDLPDPVRMCGPIVDVAWPLLPKQLQSALARITDHDELIMCAMMWYAWARELNRYVEESNRTRIPERTQRNVVTTATSPVQGGDRRAGNGPANSGGPDLPVSFSAGRSA